MRFKFLPLVVYLVVARDFALGLIAGEGSFTLNRKVYSGKDKPYCVPHFQMTLTQDDAYLLTEVRESFENVGTLHEHDRRGADDSVIKWSVQSADDLETLIDIIDKHAAGPWLASQKREAYEVWKDIVAIYTQGPCDDQDRVDMAAIAHHEQLNVGAGGTDADWEQFLDYYAENRNVYPSARPN